MRRWLLFLICLASLLFSPRVEASLPKQVFDSGDLIVRNGGTTNSQALEYDAENRLVRFSEVGRTAVEYGYAAGGQRLWRRSYVVGSNSPKLQIWIGPHYEEKDGKELFHVFADGQRVATFERDSILNGGSGTSTNYVGYFYHQDHLGSSSVLSDYAGSLKELSVWYPFGRTQTNNPTAAFKVSNKFTGQVQDEETGLYYYNARYYDPELGRFIQPDTIIPDLGNPQSFNRYAYVLNNPLKYTDPDGHMPVVAAWAIGAGMVYGAEKIGEAVYINSVRYQGAATVAALQRQLDEQTYARTGGQYNTYEEYAAVRRGSQARVQTKGSAEEAQALQALGNLTGEAALAVPFFAAPELRLTESAFTVTKNLTTGLKREAKTAQELAAENSTMVVQGQRDLRDATGARVIDPVTGTGRRVDHAVIDRNANTAKTYETTGPGVDKKLQLQKEDRIRAQGGTFIRDKETRQLVPTQGTSEVIRQP